MSVPTTMVGVSSPAQTRMVASGAAVEPASDWTMTANHAKVQPLHTTFLYL